MLGRWLAATWASWRGRAHCRTNVQIEVARDTHIREAAGVGRDARFQGRPESKIFAGALPGSPSFAGNGHPMRRLFGRHRTVSGAGAQWRRRECGGLQSMLALRARDAAHSSLTCTWRRIGRRRGTRMHRERAARGCDRNRLEASAESGLRRPRAKNLGSLLGAFWVSHFHP